MFWLRLHIELYNRISDSELYNELHNIERLLPRQRQVENVFLKATVSQSLRNNVQSNIAIHKNNRKSKRSTNWIQNVYAVVKQYTSIETKKNLNES